MLWQTHSTGFSPWCSFLITELWTLILHCHVKLLLARRLGLWGILQLFIPDKLFLKTVRNTTAKLDSAPDTNKANEARSKMRWKQGGQSLWGSATVSVVIWAHSPTCSAAAHLQQNRALPWPMEGPQLNPCSKASLKLRTLLYAISSWLLIAFVLYRSRCL